MNDVLKHDVNKEAVNKATLNNKAWWQKLSARYEKNNYSFRKFKTT